MIWQLCRICASQVLVASEGGFDGAGSKDTSFFFKILHSNAITTIQILYAMYIPFKRGARKIFSKAPWVENSQIYWDNLGGMVSCTP
jgi:hypothetical protein